MTYISSFFRLKTVLFFILSTLSVLSYASSKNQYISHELNDNILSIQTTKGDVSLTPYGNQAVEVKYNIVNQLKQDRLTQNAKNLPSYAIKESATTKAFTVNIQDNNLAYFSDTFTVIIHKSPFRLSFYKSASTDNQETTLLFSEEAGFFEGTTKEEETIHPIQGFRFNLTPQEKLIGGGERVLGMDRRGHRMPLYNRAHYGYETQSNQMNFSLPAVMSSNKYILLFDNSAKGWLDIGKTEKNILQFEAVSGRMSYLVFAGDTYPELINNYVDVTGKQPMPPRWALGNYASRFGYRTEQEVRDTVNKFIELDFPLDALILDLYWFGKDIKGHMGNLDWDKEAFPTPTQMISDINKQGVNTVLITEPFVLTTSKKWHDAEKNEALAKDKNGQPKRFDFYFGNTGLVDVFNKKGQDWFNDIYTTLHQQGVRGWWGDLGEPEVHPSDTLHTLSDGNVVNADAIHNVYGHQWAKMVYQNQLTLAPNQRPFILMRSGFAGSQRYGMIPWTGDVNRTWGGLKPQVELSLQMGLLGLGYTHSDLGGFAGGEVFDKEMYIRWLQYGVFQPIYRPHAQDNIAPEVVFHDQETQDILRKFIKLRYQLLPYNYTLAYQNSTTGMPLMRPMFFENEADTSLIDNAKSYFWGDAFLVTPIVDANTTSVSVPLPKGVWFDYFSDQKYQGNQVIELATDINTLPVLVRAGSFVPMINPIQSTQEYDNSELTLHYYADKSVASSHYEMYEDDGEIFQAIKQGSFELLSFEASQTKQDLTIDFTHNNNAYKGMPSNRNINLVIHNWQSKPQSVSIGNQHNVNSTWHEDKKTLAIEFTWQHKPLTIQIQ